MVIATDAVHSICTCSDLRPERKQQNPNTGQPHEDTPANKNAGGKKKREKEGKKVIDYTFQRQQSSHLVFLALQIFG